MADQNQQIRKAGTLPQHSYQYEYVPPDSRISKAISRYDIPQSTVFTAHAAQIHKDAPTDSVACNTPVGATKIPEPIVLPAAYISFTVYFVSHQSIRMDYRTMIFENSPKLIPPMRPNSFLRVFTFEFLLLFSVLIAKYSNI